MSMNSAHAYTISVKTGDKKNAGTDANVRICLHCDDGTKTKNYHLDNFFRNDFEKGQTDSFAVKGTVLKSIDYIELWRDTAGWYDQWYVDIIEVSCKSSGKLYIFPFYRWIKPNYHYRIRHLDTSLPSESDLFKYQRKMEIEDARQQYKLTVHSPGLPAQVKQLPEDEVFSFDYLWDIMKRKAEAIITSKIVKLTSGYWNDLEDLKNVYTKHVFYMPESIKYWREDAYFGMQRVAMCNPSVIQLCRAIPPKLSVTNEMLEPFLEGITLPQAIEGKRLFIIDYKILDNCLCQDETWVLCAPIALFFVNGKKKLMPIVIQLKQQPGRNNPVFLPSDPEYTWLIAKIWFNHADAAYHQSFTHLGGTHLMMEGPAVVTHRTLSPSHPVFKLLSPHFLYLLAINTRGLANLLSPGGWVDKVMSLGRKGVFEVISRAFGNWRLDVEGTLPKDLEERGVLQDDILPGYYFRDDALPLYYAINKYIRRYLGLYYDTPDKLRGDKEIQNFAKELVLSSDKGGCGLKGVPGNGKLDTLEQLTTILTCMIYTCSVGHAAANFPQYEQYAFPPAYPTAMKGTPPTDKSPLTEAALLDALPDKQMTMDIMAVSKILSERGTNCLGNFEVQYIFDPKALAILEEFRTELREISKQIKENNGRRQWSCLWLDPEEIPNSISI